MESIEFDTRVDMPLFREFFAAHEKQMQKRKPRRYTAIELAFVVLFYLSIVVAVIIFQQDFNWASTIIVSIFFVGVFADMLLRNVRIADTVKLDEDGLALGDHHYRLSDAGIDASGNGHQMHIDWRLVTGTLETDNAFIIQLDQLFAFVLRKTDIADLDALTTYIDARRPVVA